MSERVGSHAPHHGASVVKAWAPWCGSCRALGPVVDEVAERRGVPVVDACVDVDLDLVERFAVRSVPTLIALRDGDEVGRLVGLQSAESVVALFDTAATGAPIAHRVPTELVVARAGAAVVLLIAGWLLGSVVLLLVGVALLGWAAMGVASRSMVG